MIKLKDISKKTGYTISTVSKALNQSGEISAQTTEEIWEAARNLGYVSKKAIKANKKTIGVIVPEIESHYYARLLTTINEKANKNGYETIFALTSEYGTRIIPAVERMSKYAPDGMIVCCDTSVSDDDYNTILKKGIPTIVLNESINTIPIDSVGIEIGQGVKIAVDHLVEMGHTKIGYLGEYNSEPRYHEYVRQMELNDLEIDERFVKRGPERFEKGGYELAKELMEEKELPTAIVACYDQFAIGAMRALLEQGIRIPEDVAFVGFDNIVLDEYLSVPLTSVTNPVEQMGSVAVRILIDAIQTPSTHTIQNVLLQSRLIIRESSLKNRLRK